MESTLHSQFEVIETLAPSSVVGDFAPAAFKAREIGTGPSGAGRVVLMRRLPAEADNADVREASDTYASLTIHPNILTHFGMAEVENGVELPTGLYAVSEYSRGISLKERIRRVAPFGIAVSLDIAIATTQALIRAQAEGVEHGDLTPECVLLTPEGHVKIADFALGKAVGSSIGLAALPESASYSVARLLYEMLTAQPAPEGRDRLSPHLFNPNVPPAIDGIVQKASMPPSRQGYDMLAALLADLQTAREDVRSGKPLHWNPIDTGHKPASRTSEVLSRAADEIVREEKTMSGSGTAKPGRTRVAPDDFDDYEPPRPSATSVWLRRLVMTLVILLLVGVVFACAYVAMLVSNVPGDITVPNLIGKQYSDAQKTADQEHFNLVEIGHDYSDTWPMGAIYQQTPTAERSIKSGKDVSVYVSDGPRLISVPDLSQMTLTKARNVLQDSGLPVGSINYEYDNIVPKGIVTSQEPAAASNVSRVTAVNLTVSKGPTPPPAPTDLTATATVEGEIDLSWDEVSTASSYNVYRDGKKLASALPETTYSDVGLDPNTSHTYAVTGVNSNGESPQSTLVTASSEPGTPPDATATPDTTDTDAAPIDTTAPPSVSTPPGSPKQRQFQISFHVPQNGGRHNVQIEVQDTTGTNIVYDQDQYSGTRIDDTITGFGNRVIFRIFIDGKLMKQETK